MGGEKPKGSVMLKVLKRGPLREPLKGKLKTLYPGTVFETGAERAEKLLAITPHVVEKATEKAVVITKEENRKAKIAAAKAEAEKGNE